MKYIVSFKHEHRVISLLFFHTSAIALIVSAAVDFQKSPNQVQFIKTSENVFYCVVWNEFEYNSIHACLEVNCIRVIFRRVQINYIRFSTLF